MGILGSHPGNWFGFPDWGWTEKAAGYLSGGTNTDLSKEILAGSPYDPNWGQSSQSSTPVSVAEGPMSKLPNQSVLDYNVINPTGGSGGGGGAGTNTNPTATTSAPSGPSDADFQAALEQYFAPAAARLDALQASAERGLPLAEQQLRTSHAEVLQPLEERLTTGLQNIDTQRGETAEGRENAISQARKLYNELQQRGISRFGAGSSAGGAYSEIVGRETAGQIGEAENIATKAYNQLSTEARNLQDFVGRQKTTLKEKLENGLNQIREEFRTRIDEINAQRGQLEQAKAQAKLDELVSARQRAYDLQDAADAYNRQIELFQMEKEAQLAQQYSVNQGVSTAALNSFRQLAPVIGVNAAASASGLDLSQIYGQISPYGTGNFRDLGNGLLQNINTGEVIDATQMM